MAHSDPKARGFASSFGFSPAAILISRFAPRCFVPTTPEFAGKSFAFSKSRLMQFDVPSW